MKRPRVKTQIILIEMIDFYKQEQDKKIKAEYMAEIIRLSRKLHQKRGGGYTKFL